MEHRGIFSVYRRAVKKGLIGARIQALPSIERRVRPGVGGGWLSIPDARANIRSSSRALAGRSAAFAGRPGVVIDAPLSVREAGFSQVAAPGSAQGRAAADSAERHE